VAPFKLGSILGVKGNGFLCGVLGAALSGGLSRCSFARRITATWFARPSWQSVGDLLE